MEYYRTPRAHRRIDAPPASAMAARLDRAKSVRVATCLTIVNYQPLLPNSSATLAPPRAVFVQNTKTDLTR